MLHDVSNILTLPSLIMYVTFYARPYHFFPQLLLLYMLAIVVLFRGEPVTRWWP